MRPWDGARARMPMARSNDDWLAPAERDLEEEVEISFLDGPAAIEELTRLAQGLVAHDPRVVEVLLFGSLVVGNYAPGSDGDLIIVLDTAEGRPFERITPYLRWFLKAPVPVDIFVYTRSELERMAAEGNLFVARALGEAMSLAQR